MKQMRNDITVEDNTHILTRKRKGLLAGTKEVEQFVDIDQTEEHDNHTQHDVEQYHVTQDILRRSLIALSQTDRGKSRRTCSDHSTKGCREVHHRHSERQTRNSQRAYALTYEYTIDNIVQRRGNLRDDSRQSVA